MREFQRMEIITRYYQSEFFEKMIYGIVLAIDDCKAISSFVFF